MAMNIVKYVWPTQCLTLLLRCITDINIFIKTTVKYVGRVSRGAHLIHVGVVTNWQNSVMASTQSSMR